jgi:hypothetical protein
MRRRKGLSLLAISSDRDIIWVPQLGHENTSPCIGSATSTPQPGHLASTFRAIRT